MPIGHMSILSRVLAQRRETNAVLKGESPKLEGLEELGDGLSAGLRVPCSTRRRILSWREVWNLRTWLNNVAGSFGDAYTLGSCELIVH